MITDGTGWPLRTGRPGAGRPPGDTTQPVIVAELRRSGPGFPGDDHRRPPVAGRGLAGRGLAVGWPAPGTPLSPVIVAELWRSGPGLLGDDHRRYRWLAADRPAGGWPAPRGHHSAP